MPKKEAPLAYLVNYLPPGASEKLLEYLHKYKVHLTITRSRKSILGDYRHASGKENHRISVNGSLNKYAFLITLIHEIGHLITFQQYGNKVNAHGREWKNAYRIVLEDFLRLKLFPPDIQQTLLKSLHNLPASSCSDLNLTRVLKSYDETGKMMLVEEIAEGESFKTDDGKMFKRGKQSRKRIECTEIRSGKLFLFSPVYEVEPLRK
jgi:SprT protein